MESIYFVMSWLCHRTCPHCYEDRFHPYYGDELKKVVEESAANAPRIIANLPDRMTYLDRQDAQKEKRGRIILAGGEILLEPVRERVLYPALRQLHEKYSEQGGIELIVQTTGDILTSKIVGELLARNVSVISVSGLDQYHEGLESQAARDKLKQKLTAIFQRHGMKDWTPPPRPSQHRYFHFFGATPESWIGKLWPRGRAFQNELSTATLQDNFCNRWSGGLNFLEQDFNGSEVSIDPEGNVFPCCIKTRIPVGNLLQDRLEKILRHRSTDPVYQAISMGHPERMGLEHGWSVEKFLAKSTTGTYQNLCIGCDAFHQEVLLHKEQDLVQIRM